MFNNRGDIIKILGLCFFMLALLGAGWGAWGLRDSNQGNLSPENLSPENLSPENLSPENLSQGEPTPPPVGFQTLIAKYNSNKGVRMQFKKTAFFPLLNKRRKSEGEIGLSKGKLLIKLEDGSRFLFDGRHFWHILNSATVPVVTKLKPGSDFSFLLFQPTRFLQAFRWVSSSQKGRTRILHFRPKAKDSPIDTLRVKVEKDIILQLEIKWLSPANEEVFSFFNIRFNQAIPPAVFSIKGA